MVVHTHLIKEDMVVIVLAVKNRLSFRNVSLLRLALGQVPLETCSRHLVCLVERTLNLCIIKTSHVCGDLNLISTFQRFRANQNWKSLAWSPKACTHTLSLISAPVIKLNLRCRLSSYSSFTARSILILRMQPSCFVRPVFSTGTNMRSRVVSARGGHIEVGTVCLCLKSLLKSTTLSV